MKKGNKLITLILVVTLFIANIFFMSFYSFNNTYKESTSIVEEKDINVYNIEDNLCYENIIYDEEIEIPLTINNGINDIHSKSNIEENKFKEILVDTKLYNYSDKIIYYSNKYNVNEFVLLSIITMQTGWGEEYLLNNLEEDIEFYAIELQNSNSLEDFSKRNINENIYEYNNTINIINNNFYNNYLLINN